MNHAYRLVWSHTTETFVPAPEMARARGKSGGHGTVLVTLTTAAVLGAGMAHAGPTGGAVSTGSGTIAQSGSTTTITQGSQNLAINWASFNVASGERVNFVQPNASAIALNRVLGTGASSIDGTVSANGQVWILNPNGVLFGNHAQVSVGGLVASTLSLNDADFLAGQRTFSADGGEGNITNQGSLTGGYVALLGKQVSNEGRISTPNGSTMLAAGDQITLDFGGDRLLSVQVDEGTLNALAQNKGLIRADNGTVILTASAKDALLNTVVNNEGVIEARGLDTGGGTIRLLGGPNGGTVQVAGTLDASASGSGAGGFIETSGTHVRVADGASVNTQAASGLTGTWLIDPTDFTISSGSAAQSNSGIGATTLSNNLATTSVTLATDATTGTDNGDINVNAPVSWNANTTLTLNAYHNINLNAAITATGTSAGLVLNTGNYATAGSATPGTDYVVAAPVTLSGSGASLSINGTAYTLIHSMANLTTIDSTGDAGNYALAQDLDASGTTYASALAGGGSGFTGTFAGLGHTVSNLTISAGGSLTPIGLFGTNSGTLRDIGLVNAVVAGQYYVGGLVGYSYGGSIISNAHVTGNVSGISLVGGLIGLNSGGITNAYATGSFSGSGGFIGGLAGFNYSSGSINSAYATGSVSAKSINSIVGGLVGFNAGSIGSAYATGSVSGTNVVGGLVGFNMGSISSAYATGSVSGGAGYYVGGLVGENHHILSNSYWDSASTGQGSAVGLDFGATSNVTAVNSSTAYNHSTYANLGAWSETVSGSGVWVASDGSGNTWVLIEGSTRPFLYSEYSTTISNAHQLQLMALNPQASYTLGGDIDASETSGSNVSGMWTSAGFSPVGNSTVAFAGSLAGNDHMISDLAINRTSDFVGLFGYADSGSVISHVGLVNASVTGGNDSGDLTGYNVGSIDNAYATGRVSGSYFVGGLVGRNFGSISNAYATSSVSGLTDVGGLVGNNIASISNVYATGSVSGAYYIGGLAGFNGGSISDAYASGGVRGILTFGGLIGENVASITASFWLSANSPGGIGTNFGTVDSLTRGLSSTEADSLSTYSTAGWNVDAQGGTGAIWRIYDGYTMPLLRSFLAPITVTATGVTGKTYDRTVVSGSTGYTQSDASATLLGSGLSYATNSANAGSYSSAAGTLLFSGLYSSQQGYDISYANASLSIDRASLTASGASAANKTYDATTVATVTGGSLNGVISGDTVTLTQSGTFSDKNVGIGKTVTETFSLSGADANNYVLASSNATTTANITAATLTASGASAANKTYDATTAATVTGGSLNGVISGDTVTLSQSGAFSDKNVGVGKTVTETFGISGADAGNYVLASSTATTTADIAAATLTASGASAANKTYDATTVATVTGGSVTGVIVGDTVTLSQSGTFSDKNVGTGKTVTETFSLSGTDANNYMLARSSATTTATITPAALTITANNDSKIVGGTPYSGGDGVSESGFVAGESSSVLTGTLSYGGSAQGATRVGNYSIVPSGLTAQNYAITYVDGTLVIRDLTDSRLTDAQTDLYHTPLLGSDDTAGLETDGRDILTIVVGGDRSGTLLFSIEGCGVQLFYPTQACALIY